MLATLTPVYVTVFVVLAVVVSVGILFTSSGDSDEKRVHEWLVRYGPTAAVFWPVVAAYLLGRSLVATARSFRCSVSDVWAARPRRMSKLPAPEEKGPFRSLGGRDEH